MTQEEDAAEKQRQLAENIRKAKEQLKEIAAEGGYTIDE
jgi:hypothetical protein